MAWIPSSCDLDRMANRWKGGFAVVLALGAVAGALLEQIIKAVFQPLTRRTA
jgi:cytochrome bd-type quinol oxidase subunit 1